MDDKRSLKWCCRLKDGIKITEPNNRLAESYLEHSRTSLKRAHDMFEAKDFLWTTVILYYAEYYALYSFLQKIGVKCENHFCSITAVRFILGKDKTKTIEDHKGKRIDAQYYMKIADESSIKGIMIAAKEFILEFQNIVSELSDKDIEIHRELIRKSI
ncbi:MAG: hypothetical protein KAS90_01060 [Candidatus Aenigmarchaeota archaeon]|nr:hypothetical protein [Candidatus Aenigmarchaeota archaeon]